MMLYHVCFNVIKEPDIHFGRKNADFGQGFYLTDNEEFANRWAGERKGEETIVNTYELDTKGLEIKHYTRDKEWFGYIYGNRNGKADEQTADVIIGPIANDTIYNTNGIVTSGFLAPEEAMQLLLIGPEYSQIAIKTDKAVAQLKWISSRVMTHEEIERNKENLAAEEDEYLRLLAEKLEKIVGD
jgi:hypothetical protein